MYEILYAIIRESGYSTTLHLKAARYLSLVLLSIFEIHAFRHTSVLYRKQKSFGNSAKISCWCILLMS